MLKVFKPLLPMNNKSFRWRGPGCAFELNIPIGIPFLGILFLLYLQTTNSKLRFGQFCSKSATTNKTSSYSKAH